MGLDPCPVPSDSPTTYWKFPNAFEELLLAEAESTGCRVHAGWRNWRK